MPIERVEGSFGLWRVIPQDRWRFRCLGPDCAREFEDEGGPTECPDCRHPYAERMRQVSGRGYGHGVRL